MIFRDLHSFAKVILGGFPSYLYMTLYMTSLSAKYFSASIKALCDISIIYFCGDSSGTPSCGGKIEKNIAKILIFFKKTIDNPRLMCYNMQAVHAGAVKGGL